jgi:hypothetical protein
MSYELIANLRRKAEYYSNDGPEWVRLIWPRLASFDWFLKSNRQTLVACGGIRRLGRDYFIDQSRFPNAAKLILGIELTEEKPMRAEELK